MNKNIKSIKAQMLAQLKQQKENLQSRKEQLVIERFNDKKKLVDEENIRLDQSFEKYRQEKLAQYNAEINEKQAEVAAKKSQNIENAKLTAKAEIEAELAADFMEYNTEILNLEKELAK